MGSNGNEWPECLADQVAELWKKTRISATEIGRKVGKTRNAVLGKIARMGLMGMSGRIPSIKHSSDRPKKAARRLASPRALRPRRRVPEGLLPLPGEPAAFLNIPFMETQYGQCRYMDGEDRLCCGQPTVPYRSWCPRHYRLVFRDA